MLSGAYRFPQMESVVFGKPFAEALAQEVDRLDARAVFVLASGTLSRERGLVERVRQTPGHRFAGLCAKNGVLTTGPRLTGEDQGPNGPSRSLPWRSRRRGNPPSPPAL